MWRVTNEKNAEILEIFESKVIYSFFHLLLNASSMQENNTYKIKKDEDIWKSTKYYQNLSIKSKKVIDSYFIKKKGEEYFYCVFRKIVSQYSKEEIKRVILLYFRQNSQFLIFKKGKKNNNSTIQYIPFLREVAIIPEIATIFKEFFFDHFLKVKSIWKLIYGEPINKLIMHDNFHEENYQMSVCPFCDITLTLSKGSSEWEHFLPKVKFPLLAMNPYNLFSACKPCNTAKGTKVIPGIYSPATFQVGDFITFTIGKDCINVKNLMGIKEVQHFLDLFSIESKYKEKKVFNHMQKELEKYIETLHMAKMFEKKEIEKYLSKSYKHSSMSLATVSILKTYPEYQNAR
ncbi:MULTISPECIES: hypothetical protein [Bacillus]|uniref:hypothetical protein n=1 Tax=Bacillus TaxID=1386 RepID=UPI0007729F64|nr:MULTISPECIES: hypothetical protein [Bacillus]KXH90485.1 hypothetical protein AU379_13305 [Bacillus sp. JH7]